jgi:hypothetical protein
MSHIESTQRAHRSGFGKGGFRPWQPIVASIAAGWLPLGGWGFPAHAAGSGITYRTVALTGQTAPGLDMPFTSFPVASYLNDNGDLIFPGSTNDDSSPTGIFLARRAGITPIATIGQQAPGFANGVTFSYLDINQHRINEAGQAVFLGWLAGPEILGANAPDTNSCAAWLWDHGQLIKIAQNGDPAPGTGTNFISLNHLVLGNDGNVLLTSYLPDDDNEIYTPYGIWYGKPGALQPLAVPDQAIAGNTFIGGVDWSRPALADNGNAFFVTWLSGAEVNSSNEQALMCGKPGALRMIARSGDPAPQCNSTYSGFGALHVDSKTGEVAFRSGLGDGTHALFAGPADHPQLVAQTGQPAPGGIGIFDYLYDIDLNSNGDVAFFADTAPGDDSCDGLFYGKPGNLKAAGAARMAVPGVSGISMGYVIGSSDLAFNDLGQVAFYATITGPNSRGPDDYGLFATDPNGDLILVGRPGDPFEVGPGDVRTLADVSFYGPRGTHELSINNRSELSFFASFTDGSEGVFIATIVPEPGSLAIASIAGLFLLGRRRPLGIAR